MRVRTGVGPLLLAASLGLTACGTSATTARSGSLDRPGAGALGTPTYVAHEPRTAAPITEHATARPTAPPAPRVPPAVPLGTVAAAPGHPRPLPAGAIALTFDDGPDPHWTPLILATLARYHARATFFDIGIHAQAYPSIVRAEYAQGHGVGNHTWTHADLTRLTAPQITAQVAQAAAVITAETGHAPTCLRPPYDAFSPPVQSIVAQQHEALMLYDVDPRDWQRPGVAAIVQRVLAGAHPGAVIDMHDAGGDRSQTLAALPLILQGLQARHLVTVPICRA